MLVQWLVFIKRIARDDSPLLGAITLEVLAGALLAVPLLLLARTKCRSIAFDADGLWQLHVGKARGLVPWGRIARIRESALNGCLIVRGQAGDLLMKVEYERDHFQDLRKLIMERMSFRPPTLPRVFYPAIGSRVVVAGTVAVFGAMGSLLVVAKASDPMRVLGKFVFGPVCLIAALFFAAIAIFPAIVVVDREHVRVRRREYPYSGIESVSMSFGGNRGVKVPWVIVTLKDRKRQPVGLPSGRDDSLTLQRTVQWALDRWREENGGAGGA